MNEYYRLACVTFLLATITSPAFACTVGESEDKVREAIYAMTDMHPRNLAKAEATKKKIDQALDDALKPTMNPQARQASNDKLCKDMDEVLADLRR